MDLKKVLPIVIGLVLTIVGSLMGYNLKGEVCSSPEAVQVK